MANTKSNAKAVTLGNVPSVNVGQAVGKLSNMYCSVIGADAAGIGVLPSVMLWGAPGVGKSQGVRQIGEEIPSREKV